MNNKIHPNRVRQVLLLLLLLFLGVVIFKEMYIFFGAFLGAITLYVLLRNQVNTIVEKRGWNRILAIIFVMLISFIILVVPLIWMGFVAVDKLRPIIQNPDIINSTFDVIHKYLADNFNIDILNEQNISKLSQQVIPFAKSTLGGTFAVVGNIGVMYMILYFMLVNQSVLEHWVQNSIPLRKENANLLISESKNLVYSNAIGIPLVALAQGAVGYIGYLIFGVEDAALMALLTGIASVLPIVGSMLVYVPLAVYQLSTGETWQGLGILIWGFALIGTVDNVARFMIQKKMADVHPLVTIFGVFIGVNMFGFIGVIFGPFLLSIFMLMAKIYTREFGEMNSEP